MRPRFLLLAAFAATLACATSSSAEIEAPGPRGDSRSITTADLASATQLNLLDYIVAQRPQWLRGADGRVAPVVVYVDDARLGGPSTLRSVTLSTVNFVRYYDAAAAQQKFTAHDGPVIHVITK
jgi:hypothetical protein